MGWTPPHLIGIEVPDWKCVQPVNNEERSNMKESPRVSRRLLNLRNWSHDEYTKDTQAKIFAGTA